MSYGLAWLPLVLEQAGLKVVEEAGWQTRGHGDVGRTVGVLCHHTAGPGPDRGPMPSLHTVTYGRPDLSGPLCNLALDREGVFHMVAAGKAYHAGVGSWKGVRDFNSHAIGIEAENTGQSKFNVEKWPEVQYVAYARGCAAILDHIGQPLSQCVGHKEFALPKGRKSDPNFDMNNFRELVSFYMKSPLGTWQGKFDNWVASLTTPTHNHDGCSACSSGDA